MITHYDFEFRGHRYINVWVCYTHPNVICFHGSDGQIIAWGRVKIK